jgi:hypothetical protein
MISKESNSPYFLINGKDLAIIAQHFGLTKVLQFNESFKREVAKYHVFQKRES